MTKIVVIFLASCALISCSNNDAKQAEVLQAQMTVDSMKNEMVKKQIIDSMNAAASMNTAAQQPVNTETQVVVSQHHSRPHHGTSTYSTTTNNTTYTNAPANAPQKKGWSAKAKGAVIGAGAGGIAGALIDKRHGEGAVVGGLLGAAAGLGTGAIIDKKKKDKENDQ